MKISIIGRPRIVRSDGETAIVRGQQPWALLARLLLAERPLWRRTLAGELFCDAEDPLGALRWCLASLRRALGPGTLTGDPVELNLPDHAEVDVWNVGSFVEGGGEPAELLEGIDPSSGAEFSTWLLIAREQVAGQLHQALRRSVIDALAIGDTDTAIRDAGRAVRLRPLEESGQVLLVKALAMAGKMDAAAAHIDATEREFEKRLGERPSPALRQAARRAVAEPPKGISETAIIDSLIRSGTAAVSAGAADAGLDCLRQAAARAEKCSDRHLIARSFHELGTALVHAVRGFDDEGAIMLRRAANTAAEIGASKICAACLREMGYLEALAGRRPTAAGYLQDALAFAEDDPDAVAGIHAITGFNLVDWGKLEAGLAHFELALAAARDSGNRRREIWSLGLGGWGQMRAGDAATAEEWLTTCLAMCEESHWVAFQPWPLAVLAEARLALDRLDDSALTGLEQSLALSCQLGDPCWEAANARAIALLKIADGDHDAATGWLRQARRKCCSVTDFYAGLLVQIVTDEMNHHQRTGRAHERQQTARELLSLAARTHADSHLELALASMGRGTAAADN